ncbi:MAG: hypothetical protein R3320_14450 [Nitriliruptorales bacterium]|nr:hypothetical protein [Nitriliruptorales bacterium]
MIATATAYVELWDWTVFDRFIDLVVVAGPELRQFGLLLTTVLASCWTAQKATSR